MTLKVERKRNYHPTDIQFGHCFREVGVSHAVFEDERIGRATLWFSGGHRAPLISR